MTVSKTVILFSFMILILSVTTSSVTTDEISPFVIKVDPKSGTDSTDCLTGTSSSPPCQTLTYALQEGAQNVSFPQILLSQGSHNLLESSNKSLSFLNKDGFEIIGLTSNLNEMAIIYCDKYSDYVGLSFDRSKNIKLQNVQFHGCGSLMSSTSNSYANTSNVTDYLEFKVSLLFIFCINVTLDRVNVSESNGVGVVFYSTVGQVIVKDSIFAENQFVDDAAGGGGVAVEFLYCIPGDIYCNDNNASIINETYWDGSITSASYSFTSCKFINNSASTSNMSGDSFIVPHGSSNVALGRGAGLSVLFKGQVTSIPFTITDCLFKGNSAVWGGGILIEFQDHSNDNVVKVVNSIVQDNKCIFYPCSYQGTGGGGVRVQFASFDNNVRRNTVNFSGVQFISNKAYFGGGLSLFTFPSHFVSDSNQLYFNNCTWSRNKARLGSAIDLSQWNVDGLGIGQLFLVPRFVNCTFTDNSVHYTSEDYTGIPTGIGTLYTDTVPLLLSGFTNFSNNYGSGLVSLDAAVEFDVNSKTYFNNNTGRVGGAVSLYNKAFLQLYSSHEINFTNNTAFLFGGAIYWESLGDHQLQSSRNCFIRYFNKTADPIDWNVHLRFKNNSAALAGHAIYGTSLLGCLWGGKSYSKLLDPQKQYDDVFCWNKTIWDYSPSTCTNESIIASAPGYYRVMKDDTPRVKCGLVNYTVDVAPGKPKVIEVLMLDDRLKPVSPDSVIFSYHLNNSNGTSYTTYENSTFPGRPGQTQIMYMATTQPRVITTKVILNFTECPPGFRIQENGTRCERADFPYIRIYSNFSADIQYGYWLGYGYDDQLYVSQCLFCTLDDDPHFNCNISITATDQINYQRLPDNVDDLNCMFCSTLNRKGKLCSDCEEGYCTAVNSPQFKCIDESTQPANYHQYSWLFYILWEYVPLTIMLIIVFLFNLSVTSGPANAFVFFAQVISTTFSVDADGQINNISITKSSEYFSIIYKFIYGMWNLDFLTSIKYDKWLFCLGPKTTPLEMVTLKYIAAIYPLIIILIIIYLVHLYNNNNRVIVCVFRPFHWMSARCFRRLNIERSLMDSLATFLILSYVKFAVTSCYLLYPNPMINSEGKHQYYTSNFNGNIKYNFKEYWLYLLLSFIAILWCLLLPTILFFYSLRCSYQCLERTRCRRLQPGPNGLHHFLNSFHHCFKDGSKDGEPDRRYFAAIYFYMKFVLIATYALGLDWTKQYIYQQIICTLGILIVGTLHPYKKMLYNFLDMGMFSLLGVINILSIYNKYEQAVNNPLSKITYYSQLVLIFVPIAYLLCYLCVLNLRPCFKKRQENNRELEFSFRHFMDAVETENRFSGMNYYGSIREDGAPRRHGNEDTPLEEDEDVVQENLLRRDLSVQTRRGRKKRRINTEPIMRLFRGNN